ncbi:MAG: LytTR family DNA-binding domain-containing protein [Symbiobacteriaceae bacterium]|nr:LytTR family DNA-binding domain-containing protein [Symbiobacteriaceae bacterium]
MPWSFAICEDEVKHSDALESLIRKWAEKRRHEVVIHTFEDANRLLGAWSDTDSFDALFLDIQLPGGLDGVSFAESVRRKDKDIPIIFVTHHSDLMIKGFSLEALDFIVKPVQEEPLYAALDRMAYRLQQLPEQYFSCRVERENIRYPVRSIYYFISVGHYILINGDENYRFREQMVTLLERLPRNFARIHRSIIVNMDHVYQYGSQRLIFEDAKRTELPISRNHMESFVRTISEYRRFF